MKALILNNTVVDLANNEFPISQEMSWMEAPEGCEAGWKIFNGAIVQYTPDEIAEMSIKQAEAVTNHIKEYRKKREVGGFQLFGMTIETDEKSERRIMGAYVKASKDPNYNIPTWGTDNGFISLSNAQIIAIGDAFNQHLTKCFSSQSTVETLHAQTPFTTIDAVEEAFEDAYNNS